MIPVEESLQISFDALNYVMSNLVLSPIGIILIVMLLSSFAFDILRMLFTRKGQNTVREYAVGNHPCNKAFCKLEKKSTEIIEHKEYIPPNHIKKVRVNGKEIELEW